MQRFPELKCVELQLYRSCYCRFVMEHAIDHEQVIRRHMIRCQK